MPAARDDYASSLTLEHRRALAAVIRTGTRQLLSSEGRQALNANGIGRLDVTEAQALSRSLETARVVATDNESGRPRDGYVTVSAASQALELSGTTVRYWGRSGRVESYLAGKTRMVHLEQVTKLAQDRAKDNE